MSLVEVISAAVLDGGEPLSFRSLGATAQVAAATSAAALEQFARDHSEQVAALHVTVERAPATTSSDPRGRVIRLSTAPTGSDDVVLSRQVYALYRKQSGAGDSERLATACWAQERQARRDIFAQVPKNTPMSLALQALYASGVTCAEATARAELGGDQGEETVSAFDTINISKKSTGFFGKSSAAPSSSSSTKPTAPSASLSSSSSSSSTPFFKSSNAASSKTKASTTRATEANAEPEVKKVSAESMSNVLSIDSSDEDDSEREETDAPVFVRKASTKPSRASRVISDDEDMEDADEGAVDPKPAPSKRSIKRQLPKEPRSPSENEDQSPSKKARAASEEQPDAPPEVATTRRVLVSKTRITPEGYMVTEKTFEEQELTPEEVERERQAALKKQRLAAKAKVNAKAASDNPGGAAGPRKQKDLRSFFMKQ